MYWAKKNGRISWMHWIVCLSGHVCMNGHGSMTFCQAEADRFSHLWLFFFDLMSDVSEFEWRLLSAIAKVSMQFPAERVFPPTYLESNWSGCILSWIASTFHHCICLRTSRRNCTLPTSIFSISYIPGKCRTNDLNYISARTFGDCVGSAITRSPETSASEHVTSCF